MATNLAHKKIGKYEVVDKLGEGGMGVVYKAIDPGIGRSVAIKMMTGSFADNPDLLKRFQREAQSAGTLQHPNIVIIYELGTEDNHPYMAMEYLDGESLENIVESKRRMPLVDKLEIMIQVLNGLQYAHEHGIVHRDIKPGNVMVLKDGKIKIVDFGIARISDNSMTKTGQIVGTINYMSPEQFNGHIVDGRSDIFSSGVMFYEFLTGALPFDGAETPTVILKILNEDPPPLKNHLQEYPPDLDLVIEKCLAKDREQRYNSAEDFAFDLQRIQENLKKEMVVEYVDQAKTAVSKNEFTKAKDLLQQVLRVDTKNEPAKELMKQVQAQISVQQRAEQVRQLRSSAEEALADKRIDDAHSFIEQAFKLEPNSPDLAKLRQMVAQAKARKEQLEKTLLKAKHLQEDGDLDAALRVAEEAVAIDPKDTNAKAVKESLLHEIKKAQQQKEVNALLDQARKCISDAHFTKALNLVRKAEQVGTGATQSGSLRNVINTAREQELLRITVERAAQELEVALHRENAATAEQKVAAAAKKYPAESAIQELAGHSRELRQVAGVGDVAKVTARVEHLVKEESFEAAIAMLEHATKAAPDPALTKLLEATKSSSDALNKKVNAVVAEAEKQLKAGKIEEAVEFLEDQPPTWIKNSAYHAILSKARAEQDKLNAVETGIIAARNQMAKGDVTGAWNKAKELLQANPQNATAQAFLADVEKQRKTNAKDAIEKALRDAKSLMMAKQSSAANRTLQTVAAFVALAPPDLQKAWEAMKKEIEAAGAPVANVDMNKTIVHGSAGAAAGAAPAKEPAPSAQRTIVADAPAIPMPPPAKPFPAKQVGIGVLALVLSVGGFFGYKQFTAPPVLDSYVEVNAVPWARVTHVESADGKYKADPNVETPVRVQLPAGQYKITLVGPDNKPAVKDVTVSATQPGSISNVFEAVSANEIVQSSN